MGNICYMSKEHTENCIHFLAKKESDVSSLKDKVNQLSLAAWKINQL